MKRRENKSKNQDKADGSPKSRKNTRKEPSKDNKEEDKDNKEEDNDNKQLTINVIIEPESNNSLKYEAIKGGSRKALIFSNIPAAESFRIPVTSEEFNKNSFISIVFNSVASSCPEQSSVPDVKSSTSSSDENSSSTGAIAPSICNPISVDCRSTTNVNNVKSSEDTVSNSNSYRMPEVDKSQMGSMSVQIDDSSELGTDDNDCRPVDFADSSQNAEFSDPAAQILQTANDGGSDEDADATFKSSVQSSGKSTTRWPTPDGRNAPMLEKLLLPRFSTKTRAHLDSERNVKPSEVKSAKSTAYNGSEQVDITQENSDDTEYSEV